ncbi:hypothetical protein [Halalkalicoccus jeotgali]|uniref:ZIP Zinc transporter n=1 Tax=Halalkalicoccus jeotgali (strain DSM 18796 / CECT 7217 / JCM 14584 / KCTC 4019 / B3) TaxID=795797 RepID=D8J2Y7_HALJB|nr:hypothetical protein [Halalkalicoccus jeotgali]ADJ15094.1 hypothetical protein HacjB3_08555 [Halalkalicoccus jeotgali B3]ELY34887.1 hypothetical protein C497_14147 [Halalkalicoccus jeotgali B3]
MSILSFIAACCLAAVHLLAGRLRALDRTPRSRWLSAGGGVSVAYVFVHMLPELGERQHAFEDAGILVGFLDHHVYLLALAGFATFYGLERLAQRSRRGQRAVDEPVFWIHIGSFGLYNCLVGYLLVHRTGPATESLALFTVAMALHFLVNDYGLRHHHEGSYHRIGRWMLAGGVLIGWLLGTTVALGEVALAVPVAFLGGAIVLNTIKEELPAERESRFWAFALGAFGYAVLLLAV